MSTFTYPALVANPSGSAPPTEAKLLVDTGAMFTCLPSPQLEALGLTPQWRVPVVLADGRRDEWAATEILMTVDGRPLDQFALAVDPLTRTLVPTRVPMA